MKKVFKIIIPTFVGILMLTHPSFVEAKSSYNNSKSATASSQFKMSDFGNGFASLVGDMAGSWDKTGYGQMIGELPRIGENAMMLYRHNNYQNFVGEKGSAGYNKLVNHINQEAKLVNSLQIAGKVFSGAQIANDVINYTAPSKHNHSSMQFIDFTFRGLGIGYGSLAMVNKGAEPVSNVTGYVKDFWGGDAFSSFMNNQDNGFLTWLDNVTDEMNTIHTHIWKAWFCLFHLYGYGDPSTLPALRTAIKPNIYLYPEYEQIVDVSFDNPELLLTVIPDYINSWKALSSPDGNLIVDGNEYGYLFYESLTSDKIMQHEKGWILSSKDRENTFKNILTQYGFNEQETIDFIEFWCNKLEPNQDYIMYPQDTKIIDVAMPIKINPQPDSIFRLWFIFEKTNSDIEISEPTTTPIIRDGFEVVEWGGIVE